MRRAALGILVGLCGLPLAGPAPARPAHAYHGAYHGAYHNAHRGLCDKPAALALDGDRTSLTGVLSPGAVKCFAFTAMPGAHLTVTIDSPNGAAVFRLYQLKWYRLPAHKGAKAKWIEIPGAPDGDTGQTWSGAVPGKSRHLLVVESRGGATDYTLAIGLDPLHPDI